MATTAVAVPGSPQNPVSLEIPYPEDLSRGLIFIKWLLIIPHLVILYFLSAAANVVTFIAFFAILFTGSYPEAMFRFVVGVRRWTVNASAYFLLLRDEYPPFSLDAGKYPISFDVAPPQDLNRWLVFIKWLLIIPNLLVMVLFAIGAYALTIVAWFAILFTGKYPESMFKFVAGVLRWIERSTAYAGLMTDVYPPFGTGD